MIISSHIFSISYAERELSCYVNRYGNRLEVLIDNGIEAVLAIGPEGNLQQNAGDPLPASTIVYIAKEVLSGSDRTSEYK